MSQDEGEENGDGHEKEGDGEELQEEDGEDDARDLQAGAFTQAAREHDDDDEQDED